MIDIIKRIADRGNHVAISSHDIDLIYEVSDAVYVLRRGEVLAHGEPGEVFARSELMAPAGLLTSVKACWSRGCAVFFIRTVSAPRRLNRRIWRSIPVLRRMAKRWAGRRFSRPKRRGLRRMCA